ncbi:oligoendopeptidase F [Saccharibacillus sp. CPCC 101409]|uniref:oligoendopeptidase F n=1 Tax=Saccharibacillus sp. CPCC 101409 TaxID=3058041 RepID=UPI0026737C76|nr:oligoendopeptidase F [Saccharibacillus sp. CPCC 101409]MDO3411726.1 oligoendopeptidase F [Saccharibacillus sp. CPCC 101409]
MSEKVLTRAEVPESSTWNLEHLFLTEEDWAAELEAVRQSAGEVTKFKGRLGESASVLLDCLNAHESVIERARKVGTYAHLRQTEDGTNPDNQARSAKSGDVLTTLSSEFTFIDSEILELEDGTIERYLREEPELAVFERSLKLLLGRKPYSLSPETEKVLASLSEVHGAPYRVYLRGKLADMTFDDVTVDGSEYPVSFATYETDYEMNPDTELRRSSFASFSRGLHAYRNTFAEAYAAEVKRQVVMSRTRGYESVTDMLLQPQQVTQEMYAAILDTIQSELAPHMRKYAELKKKVLGLDTLYYCDLKAPLDPEYSPSITYEEACRTIQDALGVLGEEYGEIVEAAFTQRWVDHASNVGKSTGAFCSSTYGSHSYILMSWSDNMRGAFTLAHEVGHAGHLMLAARYQQMVNSRPSMYFIEAPSTMNELLLAEHLRSQSEDKRLRRWVIMQLLNTYYHNFITHLLEGELQRRVYDRAMNDQAITAKVLGDLKGDVLSSFWGDALELTEDAKLTWMRQPHYYMGLYPYTYSAGLTLSTNVMQIIREEGQPAVDRWLEVLKAGGSKTPLELAKMAGVDMSDPAAIRKAVEYVGSLVGELCELFEEEA